MWQVLMELIWNPAARIKSSILWSHLMGRLPRASRPAPPVQVVGSAFYSGGKIEYLSPCSWKPAFAGNLPEFARNLPVVLTA